MALPLHRRCRDAALLSVLLAGSCSAFAPSSSLSPFVTGGQVPATGRSASFASRHVNRANTALNSLVADEEFIPLSEECLLTPDGYGFSSPAERILRNSNRGEGYYRAKATDRIIDVMEGITNGDKDAALVFDEKDSLLGIFTESDYIKFSTARAKRASSEEESASFLLSPVSEFVTPKEKLVSISVSDTANVAIAAMQQQTVRHIVLADKVTSGNRLMEDSLVKGVIRMQDVMMLIQKDERLSLETLQLKFPGLSPMKQLQEEFKSNANMLANDPEVAKKDLIRTGTAALALGIMGLFLSQSGWLHNHADLAMIAIFITGYVGIIFEEVFEFNKAGIALLMSTGLWVTYADFFESGGIASPKVLEQLGEQLAEVSDICFFLLAASTIVEVVDAHQGFKVVTNLITTKSKKGLFWTIGFLTFFLSAILNNLTVTIVMVSLLRKLVPKEDDRRLFGAMVVVAANAGGVWTPIGDVTTTMLWINTNLSTIPTVTQLFLPSLVCLVASLAFLVGQVEEDSSLEESTLPPPSPLAKRGELVFGAGIACLLAVPIFNEFTGLPPYIAMLTGLGAMWVMTDIIHMGEEEEEGLRVPDALSKLDTSGILFFLGILMSIGVLDKSGLLKNLAIFLNDNLPSQDIIATVIGIASALIDNVPLVAATMGMYDLTEFGTDDKLWQLIALCAGTGGSILIIGSASGVALMGLEKVDFLWYAKKVSVGAAVGYFAGIGTYLAQYAVLNGGLLNGLVAPAVAASDVITTTFTSM
uniref:Citrate transporter-like domain-containing protein n=1 Tax=Attheya septentrionalis TaxID=420275 RepID=A0A7S2UF67_9STRA